MIYCIPVVFFTAVNSSLYLPSSLSLSPVIMIYCIPVVFFTAVNSSLYLPPLSLSCHYDLLHPSSLLHSSKLISIPPLSLPPSLSPVIMFYCIPVVFFTAVNSSLYLPSSLSLSPVIMIYCIPVVFFTAVNSSLYLPSLSPPLSLLSLCFTASQ